MFTMYNAIKYQLEGLITEPNITNKFSPSLEPLDEKPERPFLTIDNKRLSRLMGGEELTPDTPRSVPPSFKKD